MKTVKWANNSSKNDNDLEEEGFVSETSSLLFFDGGDEQDAMMEDKGEDDMMMGDAGEDDMMMGG